MYTALPLMAAQPQPTPLFYSTPEHTDSICTCIALHSAGSINTSNTTPTPSKHSTTTTTTPATATAQTHCNGPT